MTGNSSLEDAYPEANCEINPVDAMQLEIQTGDWITVSSRRGAITLRAMVTERSPEGTVFVPFHFAEAAANLLTLEQLDERAKIPDYKITAVKVVKSQPPEELDDDYLVPLDKRGAIKNPTQMH